MQMIGVVTRKPEAGSHAWFASKHVLQTPFRTVVADWYFLLALQMNFISVYKMSKMESRI